jgi:hypothetical protein
MEKGKESTSKLETRSKTLRLKSNVVNEIETLAEKNNRNFNNMAETLMRLGMEHYPNLGLGA